MAVYQGTAGTLMAAVNLWGGLLQVSGSVSALSATPGKSFLNFHGGTLAYTGTGPQSDFLDLGANGSILSTRAARSTPAVRR